MSVILACSAVPAYSAVSEFVVPTGPLITLQDGRVIEGHIVRLDQTDVDILSADGTTQTLPRSTVEIVAFETVTGRTLAGELVGWTPGVYQITTSQAAIKVYSTMPAPTASPATTIADNSSSQEAIAAATTPDTTDAGQGNSQAIAAVTVDEASDDSALQDAAIAPAGDLTIAVTVENSKENGPPVAFNIELSKPSENSVVLIYATIDGTAVNGEDYEANRGVVVIKPGERTARIEAPIIDDSDVEGQEHLQLFLTVDPKVAVVANRQIIATIDDDDQS